MPGFTFSLPLRPASLKKRLGRKDTSSNLRAAAVAAAADPGLNDTTQPLEPARSFPQVTGIDSRLEPLTEHDAETLINSVHDEDQKNPTHALKHAASTFALNQKLSTPNLRSTKSTNLLRHKPSRSLLGSISTDRVMKSSQRKPALKSTVEDFEETDFSTSGRMDEEVNDETMKGNEKRSYRTSPNLREEVSDEVSEDTWAMIEQHNKEEKAAKEMHKSLDRMNVKAKQSLRRLRSTMSLRDQAASVEETVKNLTPRDLPINIHLCLSVAPHDGKAFLPTASVRVLASELPDLDTFCTEMKAVYGQEFGMRLLDSRPPKQWLFRSQLASSQTGNRVTIGGVEHWRVSDPEDAEEAYKELLQFLNEKGQREAMEAVERTKERMAYARRVRKGAAEFMASGDRREIPKVDVPEAIDVQGHIEVLL